MKNVTASRLKVSENQRFLATKNYDPFFWMGDTGWLLFLKLNRQEVLDYLETRRMKGFNVIQEMVLHNVRNAVNAYGNSAIMKHQVNKPLTAEGNSFEDPLHYDFWDHVDWVIDMAASRGIYMVLVPVWCSNVRAGHVTSLQAEKYDYIAITRGKDYLFAYTWTGREFSLNLEKMPDGKYSSSWYDPRTGNSVPGDIYNKGMVTFDPPCEYEPGNDWVLILSKI